MAVRIHAGIRTRPSSSAATGIRISAPMPMNVAIVVSIVRATSAVAPLSSAVA